MKKGELNLNNTLQFCEKLLSTDWFPRTTTVAAQELSLKLDIHQPDIIFNHNDTFILSVAIEFDELDAFGNPTPVKGDGAGKILGVG